MNSNFQINIDSCPYSNECGGCDFVNIPYSETLNIKLNEFKELASSFDISKEIINSVDLIPSPKPTHYRSRCQLHIKDGKKGYHKKGSHDLVEISECILLDEDINNKIKDLSFPENYNGKIEIYKENNKIHERIVEKKFDNKFIQVNEEVNQLIIKELVKLLEPSSGDNILELYSGSGNFSFPIVGSGQDIKLTGIDQTVKKTSNRNIEFIETDIVKGFKNLENLNRVERFNKLVVDPPRNGINKAITDKLIKYDFEKIVYVSCNISTLLRDFSILRKRFTLKSIKLFDMFPFTKHLESVSLLESL
jgi:23S rRNA (uracil1939-C5)-methyltransferase